MAVIKITSDRKYKLVATRVSHHGVQFTRVTVYKARDYAWDSLTVRKVPDIMRSLDDCITDTARDLDIEMGE